MEPLWYGMEMIRIICLGEGLKGPTKEAQNLFL